MLQPVLLIGNTPALQKEAEKLRALKIPIFHLDSQDPALYKVKELVNEHEVGYVMYVETPELGTRHKAMEISKFQTKQPIMVFGVRVQKHPFVKEKKQNKLVMIDCSTELLNHIKHD